MYIYFIFNLPKALCSHPAHSLRRMRFLSLLLSRALSPSLPIDLSFSLLSFLPLSLSLVLCRARSRLSLVSLSLTPSPLSPSLSPSPFLPFWLAYALPLCVPLFLPDHSFPPAYLISSPFALSPSLSLPPAHSLARSTLRVRHSARVSE